MKTYSHIAFLGRAIDIANAAASTFNERWVVVGTPREFHVTPADLVSIASDGEVVYTAIR